MANTLFIGYDNKVTHRLWYTPVDSGQRRMLNLNEVSEVQVQFLEDSVLKKSYSSLIHPGVTIEDPAKGVVSYKPQNTDFSDVIRPDLINRMRWIVKTSRYPNGLVFDTPTINVRVVI